jgi:hypothetical protein
MGNDELKRALRKEIRAAALVLRNEWDPIGRGEIPDLPDDEYDSYAPALVGMLRRGDTDRTVAEYLRQLESAIVGESSSRDLSAVVGSLRRAVTAASNRSI